MAHVAFAPRRPARPEPPLLRAQSVSLQERPRSRHARHVRSAGCSSSLLRSNRVLFQQHPEPPRTQRSHPNKIVVKQQNRKPVDRIPFSLSVQTLSLPMKYADSPKARPSTSKRGLPNDEHIEPFKTKSSNPLKQVTDNRKLCQTHVGGKETENKLLVQICEAEQVTDFERILNSNAILCERARRNVWRRVAADAPSASLVPRPRSAYSLRAVSAAYHELHAQHCDSLRPLIERYRRLGPEPPLPSGLHYEDLQGLSFYYEDDDSLHEEIEAVADKVIDEEVKAVEERVVHNKNFNVNLAGLLGLSVTGERFSPTHSCNERCSDGERDEDDKEWLKPSMSADDRAQGKRNDPVDNIAQSLNEVSLDGDGKVPTITFSDCCEGRARSDPPPADHALHLTVPAASADETRPPLL